MTEFFEKHKRYTVYHLSNKDEAISPDHEVYHWTRYPYEFDLAAKGCINHRGVMGLTRAYDFDFISECYIWLGDFLTDTVYEAKESDREKRQECFIVVEQETGKQFHLTFNEVIASGARVFEDNDL